jgi:hypothetical protein
MALGTDVVLFGLDDAKMAPMTADASTAPTYGTSLDIPGVAMLTITPIMESKELRGDGSILATSSRFVGADVEVKCAYLPLALLPTVLGGTTTAAGTTPNQTQTYSLASNSTAPAYFKVEGKWNPGETGYADAHIVAYKVKVTEPPTIAVADANGDYGDVTIKGKLVACTSTKKFFDIVMNETAAAIA